LLNLRTCAREKPAAEGLADHSGNGRLEGNLGELPVPAYLVRLIKNRDLVGFFAAEDLDDLAVAVDECTDIDACEYVELPPGGIMWASPAIPVPVDVGNREDEEAEIESLPWARAELSEMWWSVVYGYTDDEWIRFDADAPQDPTPEPPKKPPARVIPIRPRKGTDSG
jgi:hypothetical protein